jgi:hypothetical protein
MLTELYLSVLLDKYIIYVETLSLFMLLQSKRIPTGPDRHIGIKAILLGAMGI